MSGHDPEQLPIHEIREALLAAVRAEGRVVVQAPTGSGKSTQIPQMLLDAGCAGDGEIVVLQPRRLAARMLARRVAQERGAPLGGEVGYQVRMEARVSAQTRIRFVTEGIVLRQLVADPRLARVSVLIFDEFHERHLYGDITLGRALQLQRTARPDLKIVVMSATLETARLTDYLAPCREVVSAGRTYPVDVRFLPKPVNFEREPVWEVAARVVGDLVADGVPGDVLVFMPGAYEIGRTCEALRHRLRGAEVDVLPLHGELPVEDQDRAVDASQRRKIIVATNIAETSLTIPGVRVVVDSGLARVQRFDPQRGIDTLLVEKISHASAEQRAGRAGRTAPGICVRLWTAREHAHRPMAETPEIRRRDLAEVLLTLKGTGVADVDGFPWLDAPEPKALQRAKTLLADLGATAGEDGPLTDTGRAMLRFPVHPRHARMLVEGERRRCLEAVAWLVALCQGRPVLLRNPGKAAERAREAELGPEETSDFFRALAAVAFARRCRFAVEACRELGIHAQAARQVVPMAAQFMRLAGVQGTDTPPESIDRRAVAACLLAGFADQVARRLDRGTLRCELVHGGRGTLARESVVQTAVLLVAGEVTEIGGRAGEVTTVLGMCTAIDEALLEEVFPGDLRVEEVAALDAAAKRVSVRRRRLFRDLVLEDREAGEATSDAAVAILVQEVREGRCRIRRWDDAVEQFIRKVNAMARLFPELGVHPIDAEAREMLLEQMVHGCRTLKAVRELDPWPTLRAWLQPEQLAALEQLFPDRLMMPNGRRARITYHEDGSASIAARIQELFGIERSITIADGHMPLRIEVLAPNHRPIQVTDDLSRFWEVTYPEIKPALSRRYPKHEWR